MHSYMVIIKKHFDMLNNTKHWHKRSDLCIAKPEDSFHNYFSQLIQLRLSFDILTLQHYEDIQNSLDRNTLSLRYLE